MPDLFPDAPISLAAQIREVEDELARRKASYPWMVRHGDWTQAVADRKMKAMLAVLKTLRGLDG